MMMYGVHQTFCVLGAIVGSGVYQGYYRGGSRKDTVKLNWKDISTITSDIWSVPLIAYMATSTDIYISCHSGR